MRNHIALGVAAGALLLIGAGCPSRTATVNVNGQDVQVQVEKPAPVPKEENFQPGAESILRAPEAVENAPEAPEKKAEAVTAPKIVNVTARQWSFAPNEVRVKLGDRVKLTVTSMDVDHGFNLPDFNVRASLKPNTATTVEFTADKKGTFSFFCDVFCGNGHGGMNGKLIVE